MSLDLQETHATVEAMMAELAALNAASQRMYKGHPAEGHGRRGEVHKPSVDDALWVWDNAVVLSTGVFCSFTFNLSC